jgi:UDP-glucose 4-epimerase
MSLRANGFRTVLVTGGGGFIGSHIVRDLLAQGMRVLVTARFSNGKISEYAQSNLPSDTGLRILDANSDYDMSDIDAVIHLAAVTEIPFSLENPAATFEANYTGTLKLLEKARRHDGLRHVILVSSEQVYSMPPSYLPIDEKHPVGPATPYALSKLQQEQLAQVYGKCYGLPITILRSGLLFGERQKDKGITNLIRRAITNQQIVVEGGEQTRDIYHVANLVHAVNLALTRKAQGEIYNIAGRFEVRVSELVERITAMAGSKSEIKRVAYRKNEGPETRMSLDITKAERLLGYFPVVSFQEGLARTTYWLSGNLTKRSDNPTYKLNGQGLN